jgi:hypothetical protein
MYGAESGCKLEYATYCCFDFSQRSITAQCIARAASPPAPTAGTPLDEVCERRRRAEQHPV